MIHCSAVTGIEGNHVTTDRGEHLTIIGNYHPKIGYGVWTDGVVCYGDRPLVGGQQHALQQIVGYLYTNGSAINYLDDTLAPQYYTSHDNSYVVTGSNHVWILYIGAKKISGENVTDALQGTGGSGRKISIEYPQEVELIDACVDDDGNLRMIAKTYNDIGDEVIRIYKMDTVVDSYVNKETVTWKDKSTEDVNKKTWYAHIQDDGSYNVISGYQWTPHYEYDVCGDKKLTGIIRGSIDDKLYTGKTIPNKLLQVVYFQGFFCLKKDINKYELTNDIPYYDLRTLDALIAAKKITEKDIYGYWNAAASWQVQNVPLYNVTMADIPTHTDDDGYGSHIPIFPTIRQIYVDSEAQAQYRVENKSENKVDEIMKIDGDQYTRRFGYGCKPDEINNLCWKDNAEVRIILNPYGYYKMTGFVEDQAAYDVPDAAYQWTSNEASGPTRLRIGAYINRSPCDYKHSYQEMIVAYYSDEATETKIARTPHIDTESTETTIACGDGDIKMGKISAAKPIAILDDMIELNGNTEETDNDDTKRMIGCDFTADVSANNVRVKAEKSWIADIHNTRKESKDEDTLVLTNDGLKVGSNGNLAEDEFNSRHNMRARYYDPINDYLNKDGGD